MSTKQTAAIAAKDDKMQTGPAKLSDTKPVGVKPRLAPEEKAKRDAQVLADHERLITARTQQVVNLLKDMGISSLAGRIGSYDDVSQEFVEASLLVVEDRLNACRAALKARSATQPTASKLDLRSLAQKLQAQRAGTPAAGQ